MTVVEPTRALSAPPVAATGFQVIVIGADIVAFSTLHETAPLTEAYHNFWALVQTAVREAQAENGLPEVEIMKMIPTGDGCYLVLPSGNHGRLLALRIARRLALASRERALRVGERALELRVGLHTGNVAPTQGPGTMENFIGDAINVAQRVMDTAGPSQVLLSEAMGAVDPQDGWRADVVGEYRDKHEELRRVLTFYGTDPQRPFGDQHTPHSKIRLHVHKDVGDRLARSLQPMLDGLSERYEALPLGAVGSDVRELFLKCLDLELDAYLQHYAVPGRPMRVAEYARAVDEVHAVIQRLWPNSTRRRAEFYGVTTIPAKLWFSGEDEGLRHILERQKALQDRMKVSRIYVNRSNWDDRKDVRQFKAYHDEVFGREALKIVRVNARSISTWDDFVIFKLPFGEAEWFRIVVRSEAYSVMGSRWYENFDDFKRVYDAVARLTMTSVYYDEANAQKYYATWANRWESRR